MKTLGNISITRYCITLILLLFCAVTAHTQENRRLYLKTNAMGLGMAVANCSVAARESTALKNTLA